MTSYRRRKVRAIFRGALELPEGPLSNGSIIALTLTAIAGLLQAAMLPAVAVALGVERLLQRRIGTLGRREARLKGH